MSSLASDKNGATTFPFILCILFRIGPASVSACNGECNLRGYHELQFCNFKFWQKILQGVDHDVRK